MLKLQNKNAKVAFAGAFFPPKTHPFCTLMWPQELPPGLSSIKKNPIQDILCAAESNKCSTTFENNALALNM